MYVGNDIDLCMLFVCGMGFFEIGVVVYFLCIFFVFVCCFDWLVIVCFCGLMWFDFCFLWIFL